MTDHTNIQEIVRYILQFLLGSNDEKTIAQIGYLSGEDKPEKYKVIIVPSRFFDVGCYGTRESLPILPLENFDKTPILFGINKVKRKGGTFILYADIVASTYFLISRYEEMIRPEVRDIHGRFTGKESVAYKARFIQRPIVEEYGKILRYYLRQAGVQVFEPPALLQRVYLTHDVDKLAHYRNLKSVAGAILRICKSPQNTLTALKTYFGSINNDPWFTFPWLISQKNNLTQAATSDTEIKTIYFIKCGGGNSKEDQPVQHIKDRNYRHLFKMIKKESSLIGLHPSYRAGTDLSLIAQEKVLLEKVLRQKVVFTRNHFLCSREPDDFNTLIKNEFTDDFTMGYADVAGFRLGTCRPVRWIDPGTIKLTPLLLHPLIIMDNTLTDEKYMNLKIDKAFTYCKNLVDEVKKYHGELILLWHNTSLEKNSENYHRELYQRIISYIDQCTR